MSIERVRAYFKELGREGDILEFPVSSATVELAAQAVGCEPTRRARSVRAPTSALSSRMTAFWPRRPGNWRAERHVH